MSLAAQSKFERLQQIHAGTHLVIVDDMKLLKGIDGQPIERDGNNFITVRFTNDKNKSIDHHFPIGTERQRHFDLFITHIGLDNSKKIDKKQTIGKRLWIAVKEVLFLDNDQTLKDRDGKDVKEFYVFKTFNYNEGKRPMLAGDPERADINPQHDFIDYKLVNPEPINEEKIQENPMSDEKAAF